MKQRLKQLLSQRPKSRIVDASRVSAAVLIPIYDKQGESYLLLTKRTEKVQDHKGQISFPGGAYEKQDGTLVNTVLRECAEEIGLLPEAVELLGELDDIATTTSGYIISPFVAAIPWPFYLKADPIEVAEIIEIPLSALLARDCQQHKPKVVDGQLITFSYDYQGRVIWGATARILSQFLEIWAEVAGNKGN